MFSYPYTFLTKIINAYLCRKTGKYEQTIMVWTSYSKYRTSHVTTIVKILKYYHSRKDIFVVVWITMAPQVHIFERLLIREWNSLIGLDGLGGVTLLENMCHGGVRFGFQKAHARTGLSASLLGDQDTALRYFPSMNLPCMPAATLPTMMMMD